MVLTKQSTYPGVFPDRSIQDRDEFATNLYNYIKWSGSDFITRLNLLTTELDELAVDLQNKSDDVTAKAIQVTEDRNYIATTLNATYVGAWGDPLVDYKDKMVEYDGALWIGLLTAIGEYPRRNDNWRFVNYISSYIEEFYIYITDPLLKLTSKIELSFIPKIINSIEPIDEIIWEIKKMTGEVLFSITTPPGDKSVSISPLVPLVSSTNYMIVVTIKTSTLTKSKSITVTTSDSIPPVFDALEDGSCIAMWLMNQNLNDTGGIYHGTWSGTEKYFEDLEKNWVAEFSTDSAIKGATYGIQINNALIKAVSIQFKLTNFSDNNVLFSSGKVSNGLARNLLLIESGSLSTTHSNGLLIGSPVTVPAGWVHLVVNFDEIWINGVKVADTTAPWDSTSDSYGFYIGGNGAYDYGYLTNETYGKPFDGLIGVTRAFDKKITADEMSVLFAIG